MLPARFPNLLVNGSGGIAVGMATNIPPHNLVRSRATRAMALIDNPAIDLTDLMEIIPGRISRPAASSSAARASTTPMSTGRGSIVMRGKVHIEREPRRPRRRSSSPKCPTR